VLIVDEGDNSLLLLSCARGEMDMGWVHPWVGLGWVAFSNTCDGLGRVGLNAKYRGIVAEYCKTHIFHSP